jgi:phosphoenolpyruvate---glycerone phosphotransferase subunit DhaK
MKKFINTVDSYLRDSLGGFCAAHGDIVTAGPDFKFVRRKALTPGKVMIISGGGSGHEPMHGGFVGHGMLDAACPGQVFSAPTPDQMMDCAEAIDQGAGLLFLVTNYEGDVMNFDMAREMCGKTVETVLTNDDVAVQDSLYTTGRRGVAGTMIVEKIIGAAAEAGADLATLKRLGDKANARTRSMGVALTSCTTPAAGKPLFQLGDDEIEMGVGIHGEPGRRRVKMMPAYDIAAEMVSAIVPELPSDGKALVLVNGFGGTPSMELYVVYNAARAIVERNGFSVARALVGSYVTSLDMAGCSVTVSMLDDEMLKYWDAPVHTAGIRWGM